MQDNRDFNVLLLDYYGELLTNHQVDIMNEYYNEDMSMNEIADTYEISKSAVQDLIQRTLKQLNEYEKKLKLIEKDKKLDIVISEMKAEDNSLLEKYIKKIEKIK